MWISKSAAVVNFSLVEVISVLSVLVQCAASYSIPEPTFEILSPTGFRVSIPDTTEPPGIKLFSFHVSLHRKVHGIQPGEYNYEVLAPIAGSWQCDNNQLNIKPGTTIYYWIHVHHGDKGYRLLERSYEFPDISSPDSKNVTPECELSTTTVRGRRACKGELIFEEHFNILNSSVWRNEVRIPLDVHDADFVVYQDFSDNCYISNGRLHIYAQKNDDVPDYNEIKLRRGELDLGPRCTPIVDNYRECKRQAGRFTILPPVISARVNTKSSFSFRYGKIEVRAKLPKGDWLFPLLTLDPLLYDNEKPIYDHRQMRVAFIRGNEHIWTSNNENIDGSYLYGGVVLSVGAQEREKYLKKIRGVEHWGKSFHTYSLIWRESSISLLYDDITYATLTGSFTNSSESKIAPFDAEFYISLGLSAGGISDFPDNSLSASYKKPWDNEDPKAELKFWQAKNEWGPTWTGENSELIIDYVKVWAL